MRLYHGGTNSITGDQEVWFRHSSQRGKVWSENASNIRPSVGAEVLRITSCFSDFAQGHGCFAGTIDCGILFRIGRMNLKGTQEFDWGTAGDPSQGAPQGLAPVAVIIRYSIISPHGFLERFDTN